MLTRPAGSENDLPCMTMQNYGFGPAQTVEVERTMHNS